MNFSRRNFLALLPALLAAPLVHGDSIGYMESSSLRLNMEVWFSDLDALKKVAKQVVNGQGFDRSQVEILMTELMDQCDKGGESKVRDYLSARIENDFSLERTRLIDGWVFAETEATLSVLASRV